MFERFTAEARAVVIDAQGFRHRLGHSMVGTEHLVLALAGAEHAAADVLHRNGVRVDWLVGQLSKPPAADPGGRQRDGSVDADRDLLASIGIDLDEVRERVESTFGPGALDDRRARTQDRARPRWFRRGRCADRGRFSPRAKRALELSLRESLRLGSGHIGAAHVGLGVLQEGEGLGFLLLDRRLGSVGALRSGWEAVATDPGLAA